MSPESCEQLVLRFFEEGWNQGRVQVLDEVLASDFVSHDPLLPMGKVEGREQYKLYVDNLRTAFPNFRVEVERQLQMFDQVVCLVVFRGTQLGTIDGGDSQHKQVATTWISILRLGDGQVQEEWIKATEPEAVRTVLGPSVMQTLAQ
ncbi:MAG TPA: ester cyclase [Chloroflexota bacterium]|nr:ester cyclase [Chloroflexota bacterium]